MKYKIYNLIDPETGEIKYVGQTTKPLLQRLAGHLADAYARTRFSVEKQEWIKSLMVEYKMPIIELIEDTNDLSREKYWIDKLNPPYNIHFGNNAEYSLHMKNIKAVPIYQYSQAGDFIREWYSTAEAARELNLEDANISAAARNKRRLCGDFAWRRFKEDKVEVREIDRFKKEVHKYSLEGNYLASYSCARDLEGFAYRVISKCCKGINKTYKGYRFSFEKVESLGLLEKKKRNDKGLKRLRYSPNLGEIQDSEKEVINPQENLT